MRAYEFFIFIRTRDGIPLYYLEFDRLMDTKVYEDELETVKAHVKERCENLIKNEPVAHSAKVNIFEILDDGSPIFLETFLDLAK